MDLLFDLAVWHAYAKLWLHTDDTLKYFDAATATLGHSIRKFRDTVCRAYVTAELPWEQAARGRQQARLAAQAPNSEHGRGSSSNISGQWKSKTLNLHTYKYHALGDYPNTIRQMGTTNSYSTQIVRVLLMSCELIANNT